MAIDIPQLGGRHEAADVGAVEAAVRHGQGLARLAVFPLSKPQKECTNDEDMYQSWGCHLMKQPGDIANWLVEWQKTLPASAKVMIGNYTYLDGDLHVKLALCATTIQRLARPARPRASLSSARRPISTCAPTSRMRRRAPTTAPALARSGSRSSPTCSRAASSSSRTSRAGRADGEGACSPAPLSGARPQLRARQADAGQVRRRCHRLVDVAVDCHHPVIHNKTFAWAYGGMPYFKFEIFKQETTNA